MRLRLRWMLPAVCGAVLPLMAEEPPAPTQAQIDELVAAVDDAVTRGDFDAIKPLYDFTGTSPGEWDNLRRIVWQYRADHGTYLGINYVPLQKVLATAPPGLFDGVTLGTCINGVTNRFNLPVAGFLMMRYRDKRDGKTVGPMYAVGLTPGGDLRLCAQTSTGTPIIQPRDEPPPSMTPGTIGPTQIEVLTNTAIKAWQDGTWKDRAYLYDLRGLTQFEIDEIIRLSEAARRAAPHPLSGVRFVPTAEVAGTAHAYLLPVLTDPRALPDGLRTNLPPVGLLVLSFGNPAAGGLELTPVVGMDEHGNLRLTAAYRPGRHDLNEQPLPNPRTPPSVGP